MINKQEYTIKQKPEDFLVDEIIKTPKIEQGGKYHYFILKKTNLNTAGACKFLSKQFKVPLKNIKYAGAKDKIAITTQLISIKGIQPKKILEREFRQIELKYIGSGNYPISLGFLLGNKFKIKIRNLNKENIKKFKEFKNKIILNLYGPQRFSEKNPEIGLAILQGNYKKATELISETNKNHDSQISEHLDKHQNDFIGALKLVDQKILLIFVQSYQSKLWNEAAKKFQNKGIEQLEQIGFDIEIEDEEIESFYLKKLKEDNLNTRNFILKSFANLSIEGNKRPLFINYEDYQVINETESSVTISFQLDKSQYATTLIEGIIN